LSLKSSIRSYSFFVNRYSALKSVFLTTCCKKLMVFRRRRISVQANRWPEKRPVKSIKKLWSGAVVGSATVPTSFGGHGGPPYGPKHLKFYMSVASGQKSGQFNR
jgi:hypothetical protein